MAEYLKLENDIGYESEEHEYVANEILCIMLLCTVAIIVTLLAIASPENETYALPPWDDDVASYLIMDN